MRLQLLLLFVIFSIFSNHSFSQTKDSIPAFGQIDKSELLLKECDFDKNAEALVLFDVENVVYKDYNYYVNADLKRHVRIKILSNKGMDRANIKIPYMTDDKDDRIILEEAQTYNIDDKGNIVVSKVDKKAVIDKVVNKKISEKVFTFPDIRPGSIIEYTYKIAGTLSSGLRIWEFQSSIPVKFSRYTVQFPDHVELNCNLHCTLHVDRKSSTIKSERFNVFTMTNVPALRDEPYMTCEDDYMQRLEPDLIAITINGRRRSLAESWISVIDMLVSDEDFGQQLTKNIPRTDDLDDSLRTVKDPYREMNIIYRYVRGNMHWNGHSSIWALDGVKKAWKNKTGTSGEINLILVNLLRDAGLVAYPVLVSTRDNGRINMASPSWRQFDKVMALVSINKHDYVLDATDKYTSPKLIPWEVQYSDGLVIEKLETHEWGWQTLWNEKDAFRELILIHGDIDENGVMTGQANVTSYDYSRAEKMSVLQEGKDQFIEKYFSSRNVSVHIDSSLVTDANVDTLPLKQTVWFNQKLTSSGNYKYFSTNLFTGLEENPFTSDRRFSDIFFGANQNYDIVESFFIPDGYVFDGSPKNVTMIMPDTSILFSRIISLQNDLASIHITLKFKKPVFRVDEYDAFREFYKRLFGMLNEQIVIKKS